MLTKNTIASCAMAIAVVLQFGCLQKNHNDTTPKNEMKLPKKLGTFQFKETVYDFGVLKNGDTAKHAFAFKNIGSDPLIINDISVGCGCTVVKYPKTPILKGDTGSVLVQFYKRHDPGMHRKSVIIKANTKDVYTVLSIMAELKS